MTANASLQQTSSSPTTAATGRSLFSRLTSPLRSRTRNLTDFHIHPTDPHRRYSPGDSVKGLVVLTVVKPIRITHITVALHGFVHVYKSPNNVAELTANESAWMQSGSAKKSQYFGNGHASLFQDEVTLCGDGRLEAGVYEFEFELEFPRKGLPTSIDFERGTISYMIRSTVTRPTSIAATLSCDRKVNLIETVDVGLLTPPKARTISLEPISRKSKKTKVRSRTGPEAVDDRSSTDGSRRADSPAPDESASQSGLSDHTTGPTPRSPLNSDAQSEVSGESAISSSTGMSFRLAPAPSAKSRTSNGAPSDGSVSTAGKTITANIELLKGGCLPGDNIPLKISIQHTKRIKSMHGIIITLYRQGRIDSSPPLELFKDLTGKAAKEMKHEEYYPKSKTGLGGLSLSSAGSSSVFRKDLSQTFAPIIIDPTTLSTIVTASIRVPEDAFPTITGTPGQMISFKYYIEVVVDLGGKLAGQERHVPRLGMINIPSNFVNGGTPGLDRGDGPGGMLATWGGSIVETEHIRREKSVVACLFELIVGTTDSQRQRGRGNTLSRNQTNDITVVNTPHSQTFSHTTEEQAGEQGQADGVQTGEQPHLHEGSQHASQQSYDRPPNGPYEPSQPAAPHHGDPEPYQVPQIHVPRPEPQSDEGLTEKQRIQRAEQRLLPSQPPEDAAGPSSARDHAPSAPAFLGHDLEIPNYIQATSRSTSPVPESVPPAHFMHDSGEPYAPPMDELTPHASAINPPVLEDKQELERQRLMAEASSPADFPDEDTYGGEGSSTLQASAPMMPSAPALTDEDEYGGHFASHSHAGPSGVSDHLPRYER